MASIKSIAKYRPVLSSEEISHILHLAKRDGSKASMNLIASLALYEWKINQGAVNPSYVAEIPASLSESLGFHEMQEAPKPTDSKFSLSEVSMETLYSLWCKEPEALLAVDIARVMKWRYENNKMDLEEEKRYEKEVLGLDI